MFSRSALFCYETSVADPSANPFLLWMPRNRSKRPISKLARVILDGHRASVSSPSPPTAGGNDVNNGVGSEREVGAVQPDIFVIRN